MLVLSPPLPSHSITSLQTVAGSISHISRGGDAPAILCCGPDAINQAVKALAIARTYVVDDNIDFRASVEFESRDSAEATINLLKIPRRDPPDVELVLAGRWGC